MSVRACPRGKQDDVNQKTNQILLFRQEGEKWLSNFMRGQALHEFLPPCILPWLQHSCYKMAAEVPAIRDMIEEDIPSWNRLYGASSFLEAPAGFLPVMLAMTAQL